MSGANGALFAPPRSPPPEPRSPPGQIPVMLWRCRASQLPRAVSIACVPERSKARSAEAMGTPAEHRSGDQLSQPSGAQHSGRRHPQTVGKAAECAATSYAL